MTAVIRQPVVLPRLSLIKLWEWAGYPPHDVIGVNEYWQTPAAGAQLEQVVRADLRQRGLADGDWPSAELNGALEVLARAEAECHGWVSVRGQRNGGFVAAEYAGQAVRLVRDDDLVRIDPISAGQVAEAAVQALPRVPAAPIAPFTVLRPLERPSGDDPYDVQVNKARVGISDKARLREIERGPHSGVHQLYVLARVGVGEARTSEPLTVVDLVQRGRVLVTAHTADGERQLHCMPGTDDTLVREIQRTWQSMAGTAAR